MKAVFAFLLCIVAYAWHSPAHACAGCSNPNLPNVRAGLTRLEPWQVSLGASVTGTTMHVVHAEYCPDIGPICAERDEPPQLHDQRFYVAELRARAALGLSQLFSVELQLPLRLVRTTIEFQRLDGTPFSPDYESIHHRNETLVGMADPWLLARATELFGQFGIGASAGIGLPLGSTEEDPFERGRQGLPHQHIQFGTGTVFPVFALDVAHRIDSVRVSGYTQAVLFPFENGYGYRAGNRYTVGVAADYEFNRELSAGVGADFLNEQPERWNGVVQQDGNVGRSDVLVGARVGYSFADWLASVSFRTPVWQHFIEVSHEHDDAPSQLTYPAIVSLELQTTL
jgi:hypothetical protein